jgi:flagellar basal-body rod protein FlgG
MIDSLHIAATGMDAQQRTIDVIANNLANLNTAGFKKSRVHFEDLMYGAMARTNGLLGESASKTSMGRGTAIAGILKDFSVGAIKTTNNPFDFAIRGRGFFEVVLPDGSLGYTRTGSFHVDADRALVTADGHPLSPLIQVPIDSEQILVEPDGTTFAKVAGDDELMEIGRIELGQFVNPGGLEPIGDNLYLPTHQSGDALYTTPGKDGVGMVAQGFLEASNVELVEELTQLMLAQRAYEVNSRVIQAADELLSIANNLRR